MPWPLSARRGVLPPITAAALLATGFVPVLHRHGLVMAELVIALATFAGAAWLAHRGARSYGRGVSVGGKLRPILEMVLHLSPVALLTFVFPIASHRIAEVQVGGAHLTALLLASSLTVPWLSQAVCLPLYRAMGPLIANGDMDRVAGRFCQVWPITLVQVAPVILLFAVPVELAMRWSPAALGTYLALCLLHMVFAQSLVPGIIGRRRVVWAAAWAGYAAALFIVPAAWYLPPLVGLLTQLVPLRSHLARMERPVALDRVDVTVDVVRGVLLGAVLWSDKFFFFLRAGTHFDVTAIFIALLPAVLAYNYYFVRLAPKFDRSVEALRVAMEKEPYSVLAARSVSLSNGVEASISRTAFIGASLALAITYVVAEYTTYSSVLIASVAVASWLFMMTTVLCYKLDYAGKTTLAQAYSAAHLVVSAGAFLLLPAGALLYAWLIGFELLLFAAALRSCLSHWRAAEYTLFWRHATAW